MKFEANQIAHVCHEANRVITAVIRDVPLQPAWFDAPREMVQSSIAGVEWRMANPLAPAEVQHEQWMNHKLLQGWQLGPTKDADLKTHPHLVPYDSLPPAVRAKDKVFTAIVLALM